jgi:FkbM family methyltransferase
MHNGLQVLAGGYCGDWMAEIIRRLRGHHEPQEEAAFHALAQVLPADASMLELGGWWSYYSLWFLQGRPGRRAVVLEPDPGHLRVGESNAALNGLRPRFIPGAAAAEEAPAATFHTEQGGSVETPRRTVAGIMAECGIGRLDLLHCDIQGAEREVLEACQPLFRAGRVNWVMASTHAEAISGDPLTHQRCLALLRDAGGEIELEHDVHESFSGDGLILARFGPAPAGWRAPAVSCNRYGAALFRNPLYDLALHRRARAGAA